MRKANDWPRLNEKKVGLPWGEALQLPRIRSHIGVKRLGVEDQDSRNKEIHEQSGKWNSLSSTHSPGGGGGLHSLI